MDPDSAYFAYSAYFTQGVVNVWGGECLGGERFTITILHILHVCMVCMVCIVCIVCISRSIDSIFNNVVSESVNQSVSY